MTPSTTRTGKGGDSRDKAEDIIGSIYLEFADWQTRPLASVILAEAEKRLSAMPGVVVEVQRQKRGPPVGKDIQIKVGAREPQRLYAAAQVIADKIKSTAYLTNIEEGVSIPGISWEMEIDRPKASQFAADVASIGSVVRLVTRGLKISDYRPNDSFEEVDIVARLPRHMRQLDEIDRLYVDTSMGQVPISTFVTRQARPKVGTIHRTDGIRTVTIKADVREGEGVLADDIVRATKSWLATQRPPPGVFVDFKGEDEKQNEAAAFLQKALLAALFLIALTLLTRFNRFYSVFLTLSAVIVSTVGVMLGLLLTYQPFSIIMNGIGIIALAGIVVNNNIILIDTWGRLKKTIKDPARSRHSHGNSAHSPRAADSRHHRAGIATAGAGNQCGFHQYANHTRRALNPILAAPCQLHRLWTHHLHHSHPCGHAVCPHAGGSHHLAQKSVEEVTQSL